MKQNLNKGHNIYILFIVLLIPLIVTWSLYISIFRGDSNDLFENSNIINCWKNDKIKISSVRLSEWGAACNNGCDGKKVSIGGELPKSFICVNSPAQLDIVVPEKDCFFAIDVGVPDYVTDSEGGTVVFTATLDNQTKVVSPLLRSGQSHQLLIATKNSNNIKLSIDNGGDSNYWDHGILSNPYLTCRK
jgi:hypothetical protein